MLFQVQDTACALGRECALTLAGAGLLAGSGVVLVPPGAACADAALYDGAAQIYGSGAGATWSHHATSRRARTALAVPFSVTYY